MTDHLAQNVAVGNRSSGNVMFLRQGSSTKEDLLLMVTLGVCCKVGLATVTEHILPKCIGNHYCHR